MTSVGIKLSGAVGEYMSTPDHVDLRPRGDMEIIMHLALDDWTPATIIALYLHGTINTNSTLNHWCYLTPAGRLQFERPFGIGTRAYLSSVATGIPNGTDKWIKIEWDQTNGATSVTKFYLSDDGSSWTQLGTDRTHGSTDPGNAVSAPLLLGQSTPTAYPSTGTFYSFAVYDGIGGTGTLGGEYIAEESGTRYRDQTGKIWTVNGSATRTVIVP
jgi:hypothetical protein